MEKYNEQMLPKRARSQRQAVGKALEFVILALDDVRDCKACGSEVVATWLDPVELRLIYAKNYLRRDSGRGCAVMPKTEFVPVVEVPLIAVTEEVFGGKGGQPDTTMYRLYMADAKGHIGYIYSSKPHAAGEVVRLGLVERDGKMRLGLVK